MKIEVLSYIGSSGKEIFYIRYKEGRLNELVAYSVGTTF